MANLFTDDFNRSNGAIDNSWVDASGVWETYSNYARTTSVAPNRVCLQPGFASYPDIEVSVTILQDSTVTGYFGVTLRSDLTWQNAYYCRYYWVPSASTPRLEVYKRVSGVTTQLHNIYNIPDNTTDHKLTWRASAGQHEILIDDTLFLRFTDTSISGGSYAGLYSNATGNRQDDFTVDSLPSVHLFVTPSSVPAGSVANVLTLTCDANNWTPGTPGSPSFTCLLGTISSQEVLDDHTAQLTYDAPGWLSIDTIYDPLNGTWVDLGIGQVVPGDLAEIMRRLGEYPIGQDSYTFLRSLAIEHPEGDENAQPQDFHDDLEAIGEQSTITAQVQSTWDVLTSYDPDVADVHATLAYLLGTSEKNRYVVINVLSQLLAIRTDDNHTLQDILDAIANIPPADVQAVLDQLVAIRTPSDWTFGSVLQWIAQVQGGDTRNLTEIYDYLTIDLATVAAAIFDSLAEVRTGSNYTLQSILDAISAVRGAGAPDLAAVLSAIAAVRGSGQPDIAAILDAIAAIHPTPTNDLDTITTQLTTIYSYLTTHIPTIESTLQDILDAIGGIPGGGGTPGAPIWPGLAGVTLGTPVAVSGDQSITASMDGVIVALTSVPIRHKWYEVGGNVSWRRVGVLSFVSDAGDSEAPQYLSMTEQVYTVRQMEHGAGVLIHLPTGVAALVTPWTLNP